MFVKAFEFSRLREGAFEVAAVERTLLLLVWPEGGRLRAFQGLCPHALEPLSDARFDGDVLVCPYHKWTFDGATGNCVRGRKCRLAEYPLEIRGDAVMVDVAGIRPNRA